MDDVKTPKNADNFYCSCCDFNCIKKSDWVRHTMRPKHTTNVQKYEDDEKKTLKNAEQHMKCHCGKIYKYYSGLWRHQNTCVKEEAIEKSSDNQNLLDFLIKQNQEMQKQNQEMQKQILDVCKNGIINTTNSTVNSHNKTFNLQVFLNEDCKDAMNINEFIESINFQLADLEHMGHVGYVEGISNIIIKNLKGLDVTKRPVHCTDQKRETIYIKNEGVWIKEDEDNKNVRKLIKRVAFRNSKCIRLFKEKYPDCVTSESKHSDSYNKIVLEAMGGGSKCNDYDSENKIIKKIAKMVTIDKSTF